MLALLLCLLLLFAGCSAEEVKPEWGSFYVQDGYTQNSHITAMITNTGLTAPVNELTYALYDNCDWGVTVTYYTDKNDERIHLLEVYQDGVWREAPTVGNLKLDRAILYQKDAEPSTRRKWEMEMSFSDTAPNGLTCYRPLTAGVYRLIIPYRLNNDREDARLPTAETAAVVYFTVK
jgi:hypothetical protein